MAIRYLSVADVVAIHATMMEQMGEQPASLRDEGLLESAVLKPQMAAHYEDADLVRQASLLAIGISQNQPFIDGNKRAAYLAATVFLRSNGRPFAGEPMDLAHQLEAVAERSDSLDAATSRFEDWLRGQVE
jgi:death on curing protein